MIKAWLRVVLGMVLALAVGVPAPAAFAQCGPTLPGRYLGEVTAAAVTIGPGLLVAHGSALEMLSLANPNAPAPLSPPRRIALDAPAVKISTSPGSNRAFVLLENGDVVRVTILTFPLLDLSNPVTISASETTDILADGERVYIAESHPEDDPDQVDDLHGSVDVYDMGPSGLPVRVSTIRLFIDVYGVNRLAKVRNVLWMGIHEPHSSVFGVEGWDVSNPQAPVWKNTALNSSPLGTRVTISAMAVSGSNLLMSYRRDAGGEHEDWMRAVDVSNPAEPVWHNPVDLNGFAGTMSVTGTQLRISIKGSGIGTWNVANPAALAWQGAYFSAFPTVGQIVAGPSTDYWAAGRAGLMTMNVSNVAAPSVRATLWEHGTQAEVVRQIGNTTVVLDYTLNTMRVYDFTQPDASQLRSSQFLPDWAQYIELATLEGGTRLLACVATDRPSGTDTVSIYEITTPSAPVLRSTISGVSARLMSASGSRLYILTYANDFLIYELAQPLSPQLRSSTHFGGDPRDFRCLTSWSNNAAALGAGPLGLWLLDTTNATAPFVASIYSPVDGYFPVALAKGPKYLYVSGYAPTSNPNFDVTRLDSVNVTNIGNPTRRFVSTTGLGHGPPGRFDSLAYVPSPYGAFLVGVRADRDETPFGNDERPLNARMMVAQLPPGGLTDEAVPFPVKYFGVPYAEGAGNLAVSADATKVLVGAERAGLYQLALSPQWAPGFGIQPVSVEGCHAGSATFTSFASGNPAAITYRWYRSQSPADVALVDGPTGWGSSISGAADFGFTITNLRRKDSAYYYCIASNACGETRTFFAALYMCAGDYNCNQQQDILDIFAFLTDWFAGLPRADYNGNGGVDLLDIFAFLNDWFGFC